MQNIQVPYHEISWNFSNEVINDVIIRDYFKNCLVNVLDFIYYLMSINRGFRLGPSIFLISILPLVNAIYLVSMFSLQINNGFCEDTA